MNLKKLNLRQFSLKSTLFIIVSLGSLINYPMLATAQSNHPIRKLAPEIEILFNSSQKKPPDRGTPPTNEATGSRGDCLYKPKLPPLTRLVGSRDSKLTIKERPSFWIYTPYTRQDAPFGEFSLQDGDNELYRTRFKLPIKPGIVSIHLPPTVSSLKVNKSYRWYIDIECSNLEKSHETSTPASLTGRVKRIRLSPEIVNKLKTATTPLERIKIYAEHGIVYETLTELAALRLNHPQNSTFKKVWVELLSQPEIGLENIAEEPILGKVNLNTKKLRN